MTSREIEYITPEDLIEIVDVIRSIEYVNKEEVPDYDAESDSVDAYFALIDRMKSDLYPDIFSKATILFLGVNGHLFSNGNKRLAIASLTYFLEKNEYIPLEFTKEQYTNLFKDIFLTIDLKDWDTFQSLDFAMYNLAIVSALFNREDISFEEGKGRVEAFLRKCFILEEDQ